MGLGFRPCSRAIRLTVGFAANFRSLRYRKSEELDSSGVSSRRATLPVRGERDALKKFIISTEQTVMLRS